MNSATAMAQLWWQTWSYCNFITRENHRSFLLNYPAGNHPKGLETKKSSRCRDGIQQPTAWYFQVQVDICTPTVILPSFLISSDEKWGRKFHKWCTCGWVDNYPDQLNKCGIICQVDLVLFKKKLSEVVWGKWLWMSVHSEYFSHAHGSLPLAIH